MVGVNGQLNLQWYRKLAKRRLGEMRDRGEDARLAEAQFVVAREAGFSSWRALKVEVERQAAAVPEARPGDERPEVHLFLKVVRRGDLAAARQMLVTHEGLVNAVGPHPVWGGRVQALHLAVEAGNRELLDLLLRHGSDAQGDNAGYDGWSPLMLAIHWKRPEMVSALRERLTTPTLVEALMLGEDERVMRMLGGPEPLTEGAVPNGGTLLHFATTLQAAERLIELGVPLAARDKYGHTALDRAASAGLRDVVDLLVDHGAEASATTYAKLGDLDAMRAALKGETPGEALLVAAVSHQHWDVASWLLGEGLPANARDATGSRATLLHLAAWNGDLAMVKLLLARGADVKAVDDEHRTTPAVWAQTALGLFGRPGCTQVIAVLEGGGV